MATVQLAGNGFGGIIQGNFGLYQAAADGTFTVDTRDAPSMLALGLTYTRIVSDSYTLPLAPAAAVVGAIVASGALSNGTVSLTANPDVMRPVALVVGTGTTAITAGTIAITYRGNDGQVGTEVLPLACALSSTTTQELSRGVVSISSITVAGLVGGTAPFKHLDTIAAVSVPVDPGAVDVSFTREYDAGATIAIGAAATALGSIVPTTAPNATVTYSFAYTYTAPTQ